MFKLALLLVAMISFPCLAEELPPPESEQSIHRKIAAVIESHAETLGCSISFNSKNIVSHSIDMRLVYISVYSADIGCSGGSAMSRPVFVALKLGAYGNYFIEPEYSSPKQTSDEFPQTVTEIFTKEGELWYKALELDPAKDALCCPSVAVIGKVEFKNGQWSPAPVSKSHP